MTRKRGSLIVAAVALAAITLLTSSSTARTSATTLPQQSIEDQIMAMMGDMNVKVTPMTLGGSTLAGSQPA